jgi:hypothetical protein
LGVGNGELGLEVMNVGDGGKSTEIGHVEVVHLKVLVVEVIGHCAMSHWPGCWGQSKCPGWGMVAGLLAMISIISSWAWLTLAQFTWILTVVAYVFSSSLLAIWDVPWNQMNVMVRSLRFHGVLDNFVDGVTTMVCRRHYYAEKTGSSNVIGGSKAMGAKETVLHFEPGEEVGVPFELPEMNDVGSAVLLGSHWMLDATNILTVWMVSPVGISLSMVSTLLEEALSTGRMTLLLLAVFKQRVSP